MFDFDTLREIGSMLKKRKLRTFLTGFAVSWGIFMFCILLCAGNGLRNGVMSNFGHQSVNSLSFWGRRTSMDYKGLPENRRIKLDERDIQLLKRQVPEAKDISPIISTSMQVSFETFNTDCSFEGVNPEYMQIKSVRIRDNQGRFINSMDIKELRKVAVINKRFREVLFKDENPVGKMFIAGGLSYTVIGVYETEEWGDDARAYIPFSTAQLLYNAGWGIHDISFTVDGLTTEKQNEVFEEKFRAQLSGIHLYDPADKRAIGMRNYLKNYLQFLGMFNGISAFIWIIGIGTLIAGITGVSNIMLITVRERTREIGIRKALGAKSSSIIKSILIESVLITSIFGYLGMFLGVGLGELVNSVLESPGMEGAGRMFQNPTIAVPVAVGAMLVLVASGVLAGYFPALKAVRIPPVEAMRAE